jgi:hypothetical protein
MCAWLVESFDPAARLTSVAIGYNLAQASVGGITPALATYMVDAAGPNSPGWILTFLALISLSGLWLVAPPPPPSFHAGLETAHRKGLCGCFGRRGCIRERMVTMSKLTWRQRADLRYDLVLFHYKNKKKDASLSRTRSSRPIASQELTHQNRASLSCCYCLLPRD